MNAVEDVSAESYYSNDTATFGDRVAAAREAIGLSQEDLARKLGVKVKTVTGWEDDVSEPRANRVQMLAGILNVSIMWLLTGEGDGLEGPVDETALEANVHDILVDMRRLKGDYGRLNDRLGQLEKRLRAALKNA
ncbi:transcriptional regulator [Maritimibacter sp. 55A14]|uniref:helix-turn-helix domain-containing protein n=1 Tax=Maritimibacter sp. 55A14 TaxID=2174844 RepID=UPI000D60C10F|nr:helix-turn-helix domain-containing protein [Maritimibacter sp. 55A14]PWE34178.1 transcriptional regulator [Maritimibacter sp. 55A14]